MWYEILKKDLLKRRSINLIVFLFIILSTLFLASSVSNINLVLNGLDNYKRITNIADRLLYVQADDRDELLGWLAECDEITDYGSEDLIMIDSECVRGVTEGKEKVMSDNNTMVLGTDDSEYAKVLDMDGNFLSLTDDQIGLSPKTLEANGLKSGDKIKIYTKENEFTFTIVECKDITFGSELVSMERLVLTERNYEAIALSIEGISCSIVYFNSEDSVGVIQDISELNINIINIITREQYTLMYVYDMIIAGLLIVIGMCMIIISLLVLQFCITFTLEESYREIGLMKALGMRDLSIRCIYLIKYIFLVTAGALIGVAASVPVSNIMVAAVTRSIEIGSAVNVIWLNIVCGIVVTLLVVGMCMVFTGRLKKFSAIWAIRNGGGSERYSKKKGFRLNTKKRLGTTAFLGLNEVICNKRRYMILLVTFCISFVLITVPLNTLTTMQSDEMASKFELDPDAAIYLNDDVFKSLENMASDTVLELLEKIEEQMQQKGYDASINAVLIYMLDWNIGNGDISDPIFTEYIVGKNVRYNPCDEGVNPVLENEVAFSKLIMEEYGLRIGDTVTTVIGGEEKEFVITGSYTSYMNTGNSARMNIAIDLSAERLAGYWKGQVIMETELSQEELKEEMEREFPEYTFECAQEILDNDIGSIKNTLASIQIPLIMIILGFIMLITILITKLFIVREKGQMAMLKSIGFTGTDIRMWLIMCMVWMVVASMILAVPLSLFSNKFVLTPIFGIMGANVSIVVDGMRAYIIYPGILLIGIILAAVIGTIDVKKINVKDMNNIE